MVEDHKGIKNGGVEVVEPRTFYALNRKVRILVLKLDHLGDLLLAIPALMRLKEKFPASDMDVVVGEWNVPLAQKTGLFKNIYPFNFLGTSGSEVYRGRKSAQKRLLSRLGSYDIAIDLRRHRDTRFLLSRIDARVRVGYRSFTRHDEDLDVCLDTDLDEMDALRKPNRESMSVQLLNLVDSIPGRTVVIPELTPRGPFQNRMALFPRAGNAVKEWPVENFVRLAKGVLEQEVVERVCLYLSKSEKGTALAFQNLPRVDSLVGLEVNDLMASLSGIAVAVSNDSFGSHLSSYLGVPTVVIFSGRDDYREWHPPFGYAKIIASRMSCAPCHLKAVSQCSNDLVCLKQIPVDLVLDTVKKVMGRPNSKARPGSLFLPS